MIGLYFSGTGNSKYAVETFLREYEPGATAYSIEDKQTVEAIKNNKEIVFGYPVQYSSAPKLVYDFIEQKAALWKGKKLFIIATMDRHEKRKSATGRNRFSMPDGGAIWTAFVLWL